MIPITSTSTPTQSQIGPARRDTDPEQFRASLDMQSVALLQTMLDPSLSASLPGAASALTEAVVAEQDAATLASTELARQDARLGTRGRGQDASSQARQQLATQGQRQDLQAQPPSAGQASIESVQSERTESRPQIDVGRNRESSEPSREMQHQESSAQHGTKQNTNARNPQSIELSENGQSAQAGKRGESAFAAVTTSLPLAGVTASATSSSGAAQVSSVGKVTPPAASGQATDQRTSVAGAKKQVIRHEPRTIDAQLQRGLAQVLRQKGGTLSLQLNPVDLGDVKISLSIAQGRVDGSFEASNESARGLLEQNLDKLKSSLEQRGITVDRLEVRLAGASSSETQNAQGQDARADLNQQHADAGSGRQQDSASGEDRQRGNRGRIPDESAPAGLRGAESAADDDAAQGSAAEPLGGWLRLDTLA